MRIASGRSARNRSRAAPTMPPAPLPTIPTDWATILSRIFSHTTFAPSALSWDTFSHVHLSHVHAYGRYLSTVLRGVAAAMALAMAYSCKPNVLAPIQLIHDTPCLSTCAPRRISYFALSIAAPRFASELQASRGCSCLASDMSASSSVHRWLSNDSCVAVLARIASSLSSCS